MKAKPIRLILTQSEMAGAIAMKMQTERACGTKIEANSTRWQSTPMATVSLMQTTPKHVSAIVRTPNVCSQSGACCQKGGYFTCTQRSKMPYHSERQRPSSFKANTKRTPRSFSKVSSMPARLRNCFRSLEMGCRSEEHTSELQSRG